MRGEERRRGDLGPSSLPDWRVFLADVRGSKSPENSRANPFKVDRTTRKNIRFKILAVNFTIPIGQQAVQGYRFARHRVR
ncbi:hypothetical protein TNCV_4981591 [Trichonephila clavipes]|nr:hypothetical protein TNCV_4981591 [Trichonephila clavipes]